MVNFGILPSLFFNIIKENVVELEVKVPSTEDHHLGLLGHEGRDMSSSWFWWVSFWLGLSPLKSIQIQLINIIEGSPLIVNSTMPTEDNQLILVVDHGVVSSWLWSSNFGHSVFWWSNRFLIGGLVPLEEGWVREIVYVA